LLTGGDWRMGPNTVLPSSEPPRIRTAVERAAHPPELPGESCRPKRYGNDQSGYLLTGDGITWCGATKAAVIGAAQFNAATPPLDRPSTRSVPWNPR
jgi:hypothetical protein